MADIPIVDSHIHLYAKTHIPSLAWTSDLPSDHVLNRQNSVAEYKLASAKQKNLKGFVFLETDRKSNLDDHAWTCPLEEVDFLSRIACGNSTSDEGHESDDKRLVLGIVPWAPVAAGPEALSRYVDRVREQCKDLPNVWQLIKGFRYLVQDKPAGVMLKPDFVAALRWLGERHLTFDLGVDARSGGLHQLQEACTMLEAVYETDSPLRIIINHHCKPNLRLSRDEAVGGHPDYTEWSSCIQKMAKFKGTYMKLSGFFSELPPQETQPADIDDLIIHTKPWLDVVFAAFGPSRILFGSDWPVCNVGGPGPELSWQHWHDFVHAMLESRNLTQEEKSAVWSTTAIEAYNIDIK